MEAFLIGRLDNIKPQWVTYRYNWFPSVFIGFLLNYREVFFSFRGKAITIRNNIQDSPLPAYLLSCDLSSKFIIPLASMEVFPTLLGYIL